MSDWGAEEGVDCSMLLPRGAQVFAKVASEMGGAGGVASLVSAHQRWLRSMGEGCTKSRPEAMARFTQRGVLCMAMRLSAVMHCIK